MKGSLDFDHMYAQTDDPWGYRSRWYEERKRGVVLASLSRKHYARVLELGCGNGETTICLAARCDLLVACDANETAVTLARHRVQHASNARVQRLLLPDQWPHGQFDLIVVSELAYFLDQEELRRLLNHIEASLTDEGEVLCCHWRPLIAGYQLSGDQAHQSIRQWSEQLALTRLIEHIEPDFLLDLFSKSSASIANREGIE